MKAITVENPGPSYSLTLTEVEKPTAGPGEVLIKVAAAGLNHADMAQAKAHTERALKIDPANKLAKENLQAMQ